MDALPVNLVLWLYMHNKDSLPGILNQGNEVENRKGLVFVAIQNGALQPRGMKECICGILIPSTSSFLSKLTRGAVGEKVLNSSKCNWRQTGQSNDVKIHSNYSSINIQYTVVSLQ